MSTRAERVDAAIGNLGMLNIRGWIEVRRRGCRTLEETKACLEGMGFDTDDLLITPLALDGYLLDGDLDLYRPYDEVPPAKVHHTWRTAGCAAALELRRWADRAARKALERFGPGATDEELEEFMARKEF